MRVYKSDSLKAGSCVECQPSMHAESKYAVWVIELQGMTIRLCAKCLIDLRADTEGLEAS